MDRIEQLPNLNISSKGPVSREFLNLEIPDFHHACQWVQDLPYGYNTRADDPFLIFSERRGVCTTKHGAIGLLAAEQGLGVDKVLGFYRLNDKVITGIEKILNKYQLKFIPQIHCFLSSDLIFVDLTQGNCHGKNTQLNNFDLIVRVKPDLSNDEEIQYYKLALDIYYKSEPSLSGFDKDELKSILKECNEHHKIVCSLQ